MRCILFINNTGDYEAYKGTDTFRKLSKCSMLFHNHHAVHHYTDKSLGTTLCGRRDIPPLWEVAEGLPEKIFTLPKALKGIYNMAVLHEGIRFPEERNFIMGFHKYRPVNDDTQEDVAQEVIEDLDNKRDFFLLWHSGDNIQSNAKAFYTLSSMGSDILFIVTSSHGTWKKDYIGDGVLHVPLFMKTPFSSDVVDIQDRTTHIDIAPTISFFFKQPSDEFCGSNLIPYLNITDPEIMKKVSKVESIPKKKKKIILPSEVVNE